MDTPGDFIVFDVDGVLVDVSESFREAIRQTVKRFSGETIDNGLIQEYKNQGGWNNDWKLSTQIIRDLGTEVEFDDVVEAFNDLFLGPKHDGEDGLIQREVWLPGNGLLERLGGRRRLAIFTGRVPLELSITLARFAPDIRFEPTVCSGDIENGKPAPDGLFKIAATHPGANLLYVGDTVDDAQCAQAAGVPFIGIAAPASPRRQDLIELFEEEGAFAILGNVNELEAIIPQ